MGSGSQPPRLLITQPSFGGVYAALSYCWGAGTPFVLTLDLLETFQEKIPLDDMPGTIRDAVLFTRLLQIPYIWVDALCIIQDSAQDWVDEAAKMATYYSNALVSLAPIDSASLDEGFL